MTIKQAKSSQARLIEKTCKRVQCGRAFITKSKRKDFCTDSCRLASWKENNVLTAPLGSVVIFRYAGPLERFTAEREAIISAGLAASTAGQWTVEGQGNAS